MGLCRSQQISLQDASGSVRTAIPVRAASRPKTKMRGKRKRRQRKESDQMGYDSHLARWNGLLVGEAENGVGCAGLGREPTAQGACVPRLIVQLKEVRVSPLLLVRDFYTYVKGASRILGISSFVLHPSPVPTSCALARSDRDDLTDTYPRSQGAA